MAAASGVWRTASAWEVDFTANGLTNKKFHMSALQNPEAIGQAIEHGGFAPAKRTFQTTLIEPSYEWFNPDAPTENVEEPN